MFTKLKIGASLVALVLASSAHANERVTDVKVFDHTRIVNKEFPVNRTVCKDVKQPVYGNVQKQGDAAGGALAGMIIGGLLGKGVTGKDDGAAAGAVIGGLIGADKGSKSKTEREVIGYEYVTQCNDVTEYVTEKVEVYSHSTIRFYLNGRRYVLEFKK